MNIYGFVKNFMRMHGISKIMRCIFEDRILNSDDLYRCYSYLRIFEKFKGKMYRICAIFGAV